jgi:hypothetical protein
MAGHGLNIEPNSFSLSICKRQGNLFRECQNAFDADAIDFINKFMDSEIASDMDDELSPCHLWGVKQMGETLLHLTNVRKYCGGYIDGEVLFWLGYLYRYWSCWLDIPSKQVIRLAPAQDICDWYEGLHTIGFKEAINMIMRRNFLSCQQTHFKN